MPVPSKIIPFKMYAEFDADFDLERLTVSLERIADGLEELVKVAETVVHTYHDGDGAVRIKTE